MRRAPIRILHIDLAQELADISGDPGFTETWIIFWWRPSPGASGTAWSGHPESSGPSAPGGTGGRTSVGAWLFPEVFSHNELLPGRMFELPELGLDREMSAPLRALDRLVIDRRPAHTRHLGRDLHP